MQITTTGHLHPLLDHAMSMGEVPTVLGYGMVLGPEQEG